VSDAAFLDVADLCAGYGRSQALFGVSLKVPARGAVAVLGRNGAG
jgi:branched-chain amino acid transport system ATP-binding protein